MDLENPAILDYVARALDIDRSLETGAGTFQRVGESPLFLFCANRYAGTGLVVETGIAAKVRALIGDSVEAMGFDLIRVRFITTSTRTLQIMAERPDGTMTVEDCAEISRAASAILDVEDPIKGEYNLEVSSPGIDRPLVREQDYLKYAGFEAKIETAVPISGQRRFRGVIVGFEQGHVVLDAPQGRVQLPFDGIEQAKLVLTDALVNAHQDARKLAGIDLADQQGAD
jgi:ribosome maturation factor RimP